MLREFPSGSVTQALSSEQSRSTRHQAVASLDSWMPPIPASRYVELPNVAASGRNCVPLWRGAPSTPDENHAWPRRLRLFEPVMTKEDKIKALRAF